MPDNKWIQYFATLSLENGISELYFCHPRPQFSLTNQCFPEEIFSPGGLRAIIRTVRIIASMRAIILTACYYMGGFTFITTKYWDDTTILWKHYGTLRK